MKFTEYEKSFLIEAISKEYRYRVEYINDNKRALEDYDDNAWMRSQMETIITNFSLRVEQLKTLADKLGLDIKFL